MSVAAKQRYTVSGFFKCRVCGRFGESIVETQDPPGSKAFLPSLPQGWKHSYGASGHGQYFQCPRCAHVLIDDSGPAICFDHGTGPAK